ncbi:MAG: hypothetical protein ACOVN6_02030, partial [Rhodoluna sp.]
LSDGRAYQINFPNSKDERVFVHLAPVDSNDSVVIEQ